VAVEVVVEPGLQAVSGRACPGLELTRFDGQFSYAARGMLAATFS
jgi:hypothetical protein